MEPTTAGSSTTFDPAFLSELRGMLRDASIYRWDADSASPQRPAQYRAEYTGGRAACAANMSEFKCAFNAGCCGNLGMLPANASLVAAYIQHFITNRSRASNVHTAVQLRAQRAACIERGLVPSCSLASNKSFTCDYSEATRGTLHQQCLQGSRNHVLPLAREDLARLTTGPAVLRIRNTASFNGFSISNIWDSFVPVLMGELNIGPKVHAMWLKGYLGVHVFERWDSLAMHSSEVLPGALDDLIYRTRLYARAGLFHSDLKVTDVLVRRRANGAWESRLSDFDRTYTGIAVKPVDETLMAMTLLPATLTFACKAANRRFPISVQLAEAVHALSSSSAGPLWDDFIPHDISIWRHKMVLAMNDFYTAANRTDSVCARLITVAYTWSQCQENSHCRRNYHAFHTVESTQVSALGGKVDVQRGR